LYEEDRVRLCRKSDGVMIIVKKERRLRTFRGLENMEYERYKLMNKILEQLASTKFPVTIIRILI